MGIHCVKLVRGSKLGVSLLKSFGHFGHTWHFSRTPGSVIVYDPRLLSQHALCGSPHISACYILWYTGALWCPQVYAIKMSGVNQNPSQNHERVKFCALKKKKKKKQPKFSNVSNMSPRLLVFKDSRSCSAERAPCRQRQLGCISTLTMSLFV